MEELRKIKQINDPEERLQALEALLREHSWPMVRQIAIQEIGNTLVSLDEDRALEWLRLSLESEPSDRGKGALLRTLLGYYLKRGQRNEAVSVARECYERKAGNAAALHAMARMLLDAGENTWAIRLAELGASRNEISDLGGYIKGVCLEAAGIGYLREGDYRAAKSALETSMKIQGSADETLLQHLAEVYEKTGDNEALASVKSQLATGQTQDDS
jgi:uncharacterized protein HemY